MFFYILDNRLRCTWIWEKIPYFNWKIIKEHQFHGCSSSNSYSGSLNELWKEMIFIDSIVALLLLSQCIWNLAWQECWHLVRMPYTTLECSISLIYDSTCISLPLISFCWETAHFKKLSMVYCKSDDNYRTKVGSWYVEMTWFFFPFSVNFSHVEHRHSTQYTDANFIWCCCAKVNTLLCHVEVVRNNCLTLYWGIQV